MSTSNFRNHRALAVAIGAVLMVGTVGQVSAQTASERAQERREQAERNQKSDQKRQAADERYPQASRKSPDAKASARMSKRLQKMMDLYDADKGAEARVVADEIIGNDKANAYERAFAAQIAAQIAYEAEDIATAMAYLNQTLQYDGLDNNSHFGAMLMLGQLQLQEEQYEESLATFDRFLSETGSADPEHLVLKGNALYRMERYPEAAAVLKQAIDASPEPRADWLQLLMGSYFETGQADEAAKVAERIATSSPDDKRAQMNLAAVYLQGDMLEKAAEVMERLRATGQFTEDKDYRQLYSTYLNLDGQERRAAEVISEGLEKGIIQPDFQTYLALAQAHYFSDQIDPAIDAYKKAAPLDEDGETYLNLARVLWQEDRMSEAKEAARQAVAKGLKDPGDAQKIMALPGN